MKNLVTIFAFTLFSITMFSQEKMDADKTVTNDSTEIVTKQLPATLHDLTLSNTTKKKLLIQNNFDKSAFLFRGRKSKREKLC